MRTFKEIKDYIEDQSNDTSRSANVQLAINDWHKEVLSETNWPSSRSTGTRTSVASQEGYDLWIDYNRMITLKATVGSVDYFPQPIINEDQWNELKEGTATASSDIPAFYFLDGKQFRIYPTPSSANVTYTGEYDTRVRDLASTDFTDNTAGTVTLTNDAKTCAGAATTFLSTDAGRHIRATTDGFWYHLASFTDTTTMTLTRNFEGTTSASLAFTIGTLPFAVGGDNLIPEEGWKAIAYGVLMEIFEKREEMSAQGGRAKWYENRYKDLIKDLKKKRENMFASPTVTNLGMHPKSENPNNFPTGLST